ncbi:hypothetical protein BCR32DRAFT_243042 [Anaeromyces robustus]|uniref:Peptidoglycan binding-like domain-containing protein n=1 Tax=Anaeromyces robustus TaxID=1754192 RepID=A0A1Y1XDI4_9FUNG|nr:hypothetical protein BCR32DRAFT_243042 [Anaeromyces robustus]|eukprot:ORX83818.1 hypothetical protein BCR32DRAFT_243042 [Anaeromyces robustus]
MNIKIEIKYSLLNFVVYICIFCNSFVYTSVTFLNKKNEFNQFKPIKLKDSGEQIKKIQEKLISLKYDCGLNEPDGYFNNSTEDYVKEFQINNGLNATGEIEELTYKKLLSDEATEFITQNITSVSYINGKGLCSLEGIKNSISETRIVYRRKRNINQNQNPLYNPHNNINYQNNIKNNNKDKKNEIIYIIGYTFDNKHDATIHSPRGNDLEICYIDSNIIISCYCHENKKHYALACGDDVKTMYSDPGEIACSKERRSTLRTYDHCDSGIYDTMDEANLDIEDEKNKMKKKKSWLWVLIIIGIIIFVIILCCCALCSKFLV